MKKFKKRQKNAFFFLELDGVGLRVHFWSDVCLLLLSSWDREMGPSTRGSSSCLKWGRGTMKGNLITWKWCLILGSCTGKKVGRSRGLAPMLKPEGSLDPLVTEFSSRVWSNRLGWETRSDLKNSASRGTRYPIVGSVSESVGSRYSFALFLHPVQYLSSIDCHELYQLCTLSFW